MITQSQEFFPQIKPKIQFNGFSNLKSSTMILVFSTTCHDYYDFLNTLQLYYDLQFLTIIKMIYDF